MCLLVTGKLIFFSRLTGWSCHMDTAKFMLTQEAMLKQVDFFKLLCTKLCPQI